MWTGSKLNLFFIDHSSSRSKVIQTLGRESSVIFSPMNSKNGAFNKLPPKILDDFFFKNPHFLSFLSDKCAPPPCSPLPYTIWPYLCTTTCIRFLSSSPLPFLPPLAPKIAPTKAGRRRRAWIDREHGRSTVFFFFSREGKASREIEHTWSTSKKCLKNLPSLVTPLEKKFETQVFNHSVLWNFCWVFIRTSTTPTYDAWLLYSTAAISGRG